MTANPVALRPVAPAPTQTRTAPHNLEAEQALLAAILSNNLDKKDTFGRRDHQLSFHQKPCRILNNFLSYEEYIAMLLFYSLLSRALYY